MVQVIAVIKDVKARRTVSNDKVYSISFETDDKALLEAGDWPADETVTLSVERNSPLGARTNASVVVE